MDERERVELTPDEQAALHALPREAMPSRILEERVVHALRERGLLGHVVRPRWPRSWIAVAAAAAVALFASGLATGQWLGSKRATDTLVTLRHDDALRSAAQVQQAGSDYVTALTLLAERADSTMDPAALTQAREVAVAALWSAAREIVRLAPDDPVASQILQGLDKAHQQQSGATQARRVIWF